MTLVLWIAALAWGWLLAFRGLFWRIDAIPPAPEPARWPEVVAVIPARNEAECIADTVRSLLSQDYPGALSVVVTDDHSEDGTAAQANAAAADLDAASRLTVVPAPPLPEGWSGKMWAQQQGLAEAARAHPGADLYLLSDADIHHGPSQLRRMVARLEAERLDLASLMVHLPTDSWIEKAVVPAFVFFFRLLYPFRWVADQTRATAAAAGGYMLIRRSMLERIGGIAAIRTALIDDCALALQVKRAGGRLTLDLADETWSSRRYQGAGELWMMIARSAYTQLDHSPLLLAGTALAIVVGFFLPPIWALAGSWPALIAWAAMSIAYAPMLRYHRLPMWAAPVLPVVAIFYLGATLDSARRHWMGKGGQWKGRAQAHTAAGERKR
jgi:hopene-associated glycosyltransferase HpnB